MILPSAILAHLRSYIPRVTSLFNDTISASSASIGTDNLMTATTSTAHGLTSGQSVWVSSAICNTPITAVSIADGIASLTFDIDHDVVEPQAEYDVSQILLAGFTDTDWNGTFDIYAVPDRYTLQIEAPGDAPTLNGAEVFQSERDLGTMGVQEIASVPSTTTFTISLENAPDLDGVTLTDFSIVTGIRIAGAANIQRAQEMYTQRTSGEFTAFLIMNDLEVSKTRTSFNDAVATSGGGMDDVRLLLMQNFAIVVFIPSNAMLGGTDAQELAYGDIYKAFLQVLYAYSGFVTDDINSNPFACVTRGHGPGVYNKAYFTEVYSWQISQYITDFSGFNFMQTRAFRDIGSTFDMFEVDSGAEMSMSIKLDED